MRIQDIPNEDGCIEGSITNWAYYYQRVAEINCEEGIYAKVRSISYPTMSQYTRDELDHYRMVSSMFLLHLRAFSKFNLEDVEDDFTRSEIEATINHCLAEFSSAELENEQQYHQRLMEVEAKVMAGERRMKKEEENTIQLRQPVVQRGFTYD